MRVAHGAPAGGNGNGQEENQNEVSRVPAAPALFPREAPTPRDWVNRQTHLKRYTTMPRGGHFAALEGTELFAADLRAFLGELTPAKERAHPR